MRTMCDPKHKTKNGKTSQNPSRSCVRTMHLCVSDIGDLQLVIPELPQKASWSFEGVISSHAIEAIALTVLSSWLQLVAY